MTILKEMRKFHNYIKKLYLDKYIVSPSKLLDLACGKGGDLIKWKNNKNIISIIGYDIDKPSIEEARRRLKTLSIHKPIHLYEKDLSTNILNCKEKYEVITSNFALHYFFKNTQTLKTILTSINNCSQKGTIFITTLFDGSVLKNINTQDYYIKLLPTKNKYLGREVEVYVKDAVLDKPTVEYLVEPSFLIQKMKSIGFSLIETRSFEEVYKEQKTYKLTEEEQKFSFMNRVYVFVKTV